MLNFFVGKMLGTAQKCPQKYYGKAFTDINYKCTFFPGKIMEIPERFMVEIDSWDFGL